MNLEEFKKKVQQTLQQPLRVDSPNDLCADIAVIESLAYLSVKLQANAEARLSKANEELRLKKLEYTKEATGTVYEKTLQVEANCNSVLKEIDDANVELHYWKSISKLIEQKTSLAQSVLTSIGNQIKAGIYAK